MMESCDGELTCKDGSDERHCKIAKYFMLTSPRAPHPPAIISFTRSDGRFISLPLEPRGSTNYSLLCPDSHFECLLLHYLCLPVYLRCNGVNDCPGHEDEAGCERYTCPGYYRCRGSKICLHPDNVCDGVNQCPQQDDELYCYVTLPENCTCYGWACFCARAAPIGDYPEMRFLHAEKSLMTPADVSNNRMLVYLSLAQCRLEQLAVPLLPNLRVLDVGWNRLTSISGDSLHRQLPKLRDLTLANNPLLSPFLALRSGDEPFGSVVRLDLSGVSLQDEDVTLLKWFPALTHLNLSHTSLDRIVDSDVGLPTSLLVLDLRGCPVTEFSPFVFRRLPDLQLVFTDNYKLCCPELLPEGFNVRQCHSTAQLISSCTALLDSDVYRVVLSVLCVLTVVGNVCTLLYRLTVRRRASSLSFGQFVTQLGVSDLLMGVYLAMIGVADRMYSGSYLWKEVTWKKSAACQAAGFLSLLSSEVSAFIVCLITLDRFLVLRFPFSTLHFRKRSARVACTVVWMLGITLAGVPLLPLTSHWNFYSQTGICIPLIIPSTDFAGRTYSFSILVVLNFVLFLLIAAGQMFIYASVRANSMATSDSSKQAKDLTIARRLVSVAVSDFLCWFPVGLLGLLASRGTTIPAEVNVAMAVLVLPLNSALNPFLYTANILLEKRRRLKELRLKKAMLTQLQAENQTHCEDVQHSETTRQEALDLLSSWLKNGTVSLEQIQTKCQQYM